MQYRCLASQSSLAGRVSAWRWFTVRRSFACLLTLLAMPLTAFANHALVYRWVDPVDGDVHYAAMAPGQQPFEVIAIKHAPPTDIALQQRLAELDSEIDERIDARKQQREAKRLDAALTAARQQDCATLRDRQVTLESRPGRRFLIMDAQGNARRMTEEERQTNLTIGSQQITERCTTPGTRKP